jgi:hypothetical protein
MFTGSQRKIQKPVRTKFRKNREHDVESDEKKQKNRDKSLHRLMRQEKEDYVL